VARDLLRVFWQRPTKQEVEMSQINVNAPEPIADTRGDRSAAAGINLITVLIVLAVLAVIAWYLFTGPLRSFGAGGTTNINVNPAPTTTTNVNVNPPSQPQAPAPAAPAPAGNTGAGAGTGNNPPPANP
jgi:hypothetical protein